MVMPTYSGPTNLPPLEAVALGCPVVYSDLPGCREQMGAAALYCDLRDPDDLAVQLRSILTDPAVRARLSAMGLQRSRELAQIDYAERMLPVLNRHAYVRQRWAWPRTTTQSSTLHPRTAIAP